VLSLTVAVVAIAIFGVFVALAYRRRWQWTGLPAAGFSDNAVAQRPKTLWNWLELLGIPLALATLAFLLNDAQTQRELRRVASRSVVYRDENRSGWVVAVSCPVAFVASRVPERWARWENADRAGRVCFLG
jgi:hypothetical protein